MPYIFIETIRKIFIWHAINKFWKSNELFKDIHWLTNQRHKMAA
jgi:hypothetical protein